MLKLNLSKGKAVWHFCQQTDKNKTKRHWKCFWLQCVFVSYKPTTNYIQACSNDGIETSTHIPLPLPVVCFGVSKCWLCVSRLCPVRLLPIDSRWDLSIKHPEPCSLPNPRVIQSHPLHTHTFVHTHRHTPSSPVIHQYFHQGLYWSPPSSLFTPCSTTSGPRQRPCRFNFWQIYNKAQVII